MGSRGPGVRFVAAVVCACVVGFAGPVGARQAPAGQRADAAAAGFPAVAGSTTPIVQERNPAGHVVVRAVRLDTPLKFDGRLDEAIYQTVPSMGGFVQAEPHEGDPETQKTEVWVFFDNENIYVTGRCWVTHPIVATEMRHDNSVIFNGNDNLGFIFDTFHDQRNGVFFATNAIGGRAEGQSANDRQYVAEWNGVWDSRVARFEHGWTVESVVPFKTLRYGPGRSQVWGFNVARKTYGSMHEHTYLSPVPAARGSGGILAVSLSATLVGLEVPPPSRNLEVKPYATMNLTTDRTVTPKVSNDLGRDVGLDVKYGITPNLTTDFTYNTDFAQVEADEQQINLTRFSLFFPEKRDFFLENQGMFGFGGATTSSNSAPSDTPILFYTRQIGLDQGRAVPIRAGGRMTGRVGRYTLGVLNIRSGNEPTYGARATTFSVVRVRRDVLRKSSLGLMYTGRSLGQGGGDGGNQAIGVDGTFGFFNNMAINTYWARTRTPGLDGDDTSYRAQLDYAGDRYGVQAEQLRVGSHFNPEVGFVRRGWDPLESTCRHASLSIL